MVTGEIGQEITVGCVCVHHFRVSSSMYAERLIIEEVVDAGRHSKVRGTKLIQDWRDANKWTWKKSKWIRADRVTVTPLTKEALNAMITVVAG